MSASFLKIIVPALILFSLSSGVALAARAGGVFTETFSKDVIYPNTGDGGFPWDAISGSWHVEGGRFIQDESGIENAIAIPEKIRTVYSGKGGQSSKTTNFTIKTQLKTNDPSGYGESYWEVRETAL